MFNQSNLTSGKGLMAVAGLVVLIAAIAIGGLVLTGNLDSSRDAGRGGSDEPTAPGVTVRLDNRGRAPEFERIEVWMNGEPTSLEKLRGQVVLIDFWTRGCINCRRTLPYVGQWHDRYAAYGLKVVGIHTPEFAHEKDVAALRAALGELDVDWAVAVDNQKATWRAWKNRYWPRKYLIDGRGNVRYDRIGEGAYEQTEHAIRALLRENGADLEGVSTGGHR